MGTQSVEELYDDYPSQYITGCEVPAYNREAYCLTARDMHYIFKWLREEIDGDNRGDIDGERYGIDFKVYRIEVVHHYECHQEPGGDSYCGIWEMVGVTDVDRIEVVGVFDEDGTEYPRILKQLNDYAKRNNI